MPGGLVKHCVICGKPLFAPAKTIALRREDESALTEAAAALAKQAPKTGPPAELDDLLTVDKRLTSLLAFVPLWGPWQLSRSSQHTPQEKLLLATASLGVTAILALATWALLPGAAEHVRETRGRIDSQIRVLDGLIQEYYREHGALPDDSVWQRSASGDLRFYDPWGRIYRYSPGAEQFAIGTYGREGVPGGKGDDADVSAEFRVTTEPAAGIKSVEPTPR